MKDDTHNFIINKISKQFEVFINQEDCPLRNPNLMSELEELSKFDLEETFNKCMSKGASLLSSICKICFGVNVEETLENNRKYIKQRLLVIIAISAFSRSQKVNVFQKVLGEVFKLRNSGKQTMQLLHRIGLSLVTPSIRADLDTIGTHFLSEIKVRKAEIEEWFVRRKMLEKIKSQYILSVEFTDDKYVAPIVELGEEKREAEVKLNIYNPDEYVKKLVEQHAYDVEAALDDHIDSRPKMYDCTYDNVDISVNSREFLMGQKDNSLHWCSSIVVEDVIDAKELSDSSFDRSSHSADFEERINLTEDENEHLLGCYVQLICNYISLNWPKVFPDLRSNRIKHQYSEQFEAPVKIYTGPLVCETESTLQGISKVITKLTDELCPTVLNEEGKNVPIYPTTFSGDQKTEKSARSAQLALLDNGLMRDKLSFIEGRHELLHFMFMLTDVGLDIFADSDNIEEGVCLSRLIKLLNPKLEKKKGKDAYYAYRELYSDIFLAQIGDFLKQFLNTSNLNEDATPESIEKEEDHEKKQKCFRNLIRKFILSLDDGYSKCKENMEDAKKLPEFYPHEKFLKHALKNKKTADHPSDPPKSTKKIPENNSSKPSEDSEPPDKKNDYARSLFSFLGVYHLMLDSIKEGNGLNAYLIQKQLLKAIHSTGHKNYACSISSFKNNVLSHPNPQFSHRFMWNVFAGRGGKSMKFARDQKNEHLNRYLKDYFKSLGVNLNERNAQRINKAADIGVKMETNVTDFFETDHVGKSHTNKDRSEQINKLMEIFKYEEVSSKKPGRKFNGPCVPSSLTTFFDEAHYRSWHLAKDKEFAKISGIRKKYFS